ncbi:SH2 domain protein, partial [Opisthorchis viverrini]
MRREDQRRIIDDGTSRQYSSRCYDESKGTGTAEILEEMETITLQPIGRGVHDLEPVRSIARSYRANTPTGHRFSPIPMVSRPHSSAARIRSQTPTFKSGGLSPVKPNSNVSITTFPKHPGTISVSETVHSLPVTPPTQVHRTFAQANPVIPHQQRIEHQEQAHEPHEPQMGYINRPSSPGPIPGRSRIFDDTDTSAHVAMPFLHNSSQTIRPPSPSKGASRAYTPGPDTSDGYRTIATTNVQREIHSPGAHSPFIVNDSRGTRYNSLYEARASENHFVSNTFPEQQWRAHTEMHSSVFYPRITTVPPNYAASTSGASGIGDSTDWEQGLMKLVRETYRDWYMPDKKREDSTLLQPNALNTASNLDSGETQLANSVHFLLRDREPGAFIIRNSVSCVNSFSLGVKSPPPGPLVSANPEYMKSGPVKHFMIQTIPMPDGRTEGVQLRGFEDQPIFPGLVQFVHHHCLHPGPLPCQLRLPVTSPNSHTRMGTGYFGSLTKYGQGNSTTAGVGGTTLHMLYLGSVNVDRLENEAAVRRAITHILTQSAINVNKLTKRCEAVVVVSPQDGIRIHDRAKRGLLEKHIKPNQIVFCGLDPESRLYTDPELRTRGMIHARTVGLVVRKKQFWMHGNLVYVLTEIDPSQPALNLVQYVNQCGVLQNFSCCWFFDCSDCLLSSGFFFPIFAFPIDLLLHDFHQLGQ